MYGFFFFLHVPPINTDMQIVFLFIVSLFLTNGATKPPAEVVDPEYGEWREPRLT